VPAGSSGLVPQRGRGRSGYTLTKTQDPALSTEEIGRVDAVLLSHERGGDRPATGFALTALEDPGNAIYFSGDTVWYDGVEEVAERFSVSVALLCLGAQR